MSGGGGPTRPRGRVLLVFPPAFFRLASGHLPNTGLELPYTFPPLGLLYLGTILQHAGFAVEVIDFAGEPYERERLLAAARRADVVGFSVVRNNRDKVTALIAELVAAGVDRPIIVGGPDVTLRPVLFDHTVATVIGEAELTIVDIVERILGGGDLAQARGILFRDPSTGEARGGLPPELPTRLDEIPMPDRDLCDRNHYSLFGPRQRGKTAVVITSRGCPFRCSFCSRIALTQNTYRVRSPEDVLAELGALHRDGYRFLFFGDNNFLIDRRRVLAILDGIIARAFDFRIVVAGRVDAADPELFARLRRAGVFLLSMGLESGVQSSLDFLNKGTTVERNTRAVVLAHQAGLFVHANFILGCAEETEQDLLATRRFVLELPLDSIFVNVLSYQYGSALWTDAHARGLIPDGQLDQTATSEHGLARLPEARLRQALKDLLLHFFFRPSYWARLLAKSARTGDYDFMRLVAGLCRRYLAAEAKKSLGARVPARVWAWLKHPGAVEAA
jgi:anaerobic magnesium-protoporphyrin IX monomethyl ester cyclase